MTGPQLRILIADDHTILRESLREILEAEPDLVVVGEAGTNQEAVSVAASRSPDLVLLDIEMPGGPATTTVRQMLGQPQPPKVVILSMYEDPEFVQSMLGLGVSGYLHKNITRQHLVSVLRTLSHTDRVAVAVSRGAVRAGLARREALSSRELEVLELVAQAMSNRQVASRLAVTEGTVKRHLRNIFEKLGAVSRIDAVNKAVAASFIRDQAR